MFTRNNIIKPLSTSVKNIPSFQEITENYLLKDNTYFCKTENNNNIELVVTNKGKQIEVKEEDASEIFVYDIISKEFQSNSLSSNKIVLYEPNKNIIPNFYIEYYPKINQIPMETGFFDECKLNHQNLTILDKNMENVWTSDLFYIMTNYDNLYIGHMRPTSIITEDVSIENTEIIVCSNDALKATENSYIHVGDEIMKVTGISNHSTKVKIFDKNINSAVNSGPTTSDGLGNVTNVTTLSNYSGTVITITWDDAQNMTNTVPNSYPNDNPNGYKIYDHTTDASGVLIGEIYQSGTPLLWNPGNFEFLYENLTPNTTYNLRITTVFGYLWVQPDDRETDGISFTVTTTQTSEIDIASFEINPGLILAKGDEIFKSDGTSIGLISENPTDTKLVCENVITTELEDNSEIFTKRKLTVERGQLNTEPKAYIADTSDITKYTCVSLMNHTVDLENISSRDFLNGLIIGIKESVVEANGGYSLASSTMNQKIQENQTITLSYSSQHKWISNDVDSKNDIAPCIVSSGQVTKQCRQPHPDFQLFDPLQYMNVDSMFSSNKYNKIKTYIESSINAGTEFNILEQSSNRYVAVIDTENISSFNNVTASKNIKSIRMRHSYEDDNDNMININLLWFFHKISQPQSIMDLENDIIIRKFKKDTSVDKFSENSDNLEILLNSLELQEAFNSEIYIFTDKWYKTSISNNLLNMGEQLTDLNISTSSTVYVLHESNKDIQFL